MPDLDLAIRSGTVVTAADVTRRGIGFRSGAIPGSPGDRQFLKRRLSPFASPHEIQGGMAE